MSEPYGYDEQLDPSAPHAKQDSVTPPGWYPDPEDERSLRYWNGTAWSAHRAPNNVVARKVGFLDSIKMGFKGVFTYKGRSTTGEFWWFFLFGMIIFAVLYLLGISPTLTELSAVARAPEAFTGLAAIPARIWLVVFLIFLIPLTVRRLHDKGLPGWLTFLILVPIGPFVVLMMVIGQGTQGSNKYGPVPT